MNRICSDNEVRGTGGEALGVGEDQGYRLSVKEGDVRGAQLAAEADDRPAGTAWRSLRRVLLGRSATRRDP